MADPDQQHGLIFRQDYFADLAAFAALVDLLHDTFSIDIGLQSQLSGPDPSSMPFGYFDADGRCVANFSVFSMPLMFNGRVVKAAGYQSGAVRPEWRGRGLYRDLMRRSARRLALQDRADLDAMSAILSRRVPVSQSFAVVRQSEMFHLNACFDPDIRLTLIENEVIVAWKQDGATLRLLDVAGHSIPALADLLAALDVDAARIEVCFPPDQLHWRGTPEPYQGYCALMVRGDIAHAIEAPVMLSPMAEF